MPARRFDQRPSGVASAGDLPWGSHFCVVYQAGQEPLDVLVPYLRAGLENNELCAWEVAGPSAVADTRQALLEAAPAFAEHLRSGQLEVVSAGAARDEESLVVRLDRAILAGFDGLRLVRPAAPGPPGVAALAAETETIGRLTVVAAYLYPREGLGAVGLMEAVRSHRFALVCSAGRWEVLASSEARTARDALERSEEKLQSLFRNMSEGFAFHRIVRDAAGRPCDYVFLEINPAFERLTGLKAADVLGQRVTRVLPGIEADPTDWLGKYGRVAATGEPLQFESQAAALNRWYAVSAFSPHKGYFAVTFADITDRRRAEAERRAIEERLLVTLRSIGDAVISTDTRGRVVLLNRVAEEMTGYTQEEAAGRPLSEVFRVVDESTGRPAEDPVRKVIESGTVVGLAHHAVLVRRDGRSVGIADSAAPVRGDNGRLLGVVLVFRDVTAERQAREALHAANARLVDSDRRKNEFLAVLSHELRNPLAPIRYSLQVLDRAAAAGGEAARAKAVIDRQVSHLSRLVDDLLDVTRISRNKIHLQRERVELGEVVRRCAEDQRSLFERNGVRLEVAPGAGPLHIRADATRVAQVVGNLLQNAAKFTGPGGCVRLSARADAATGEAVVSVRDTGVGMTQETLAGLFQPFMQAEQTLDRSQGGLGLGLALVKGLVELHGGAVAATSDGPGKGAEFTVRLPLDAAPAPLQPAPAAGDERRARRILIVEDNVDSAESLRELLELDGHEVDVAFNGTEGVEKARRLRPGVVLCDLGLPGLDGYAVARAIRADESLQDTYLVALSGYALPEDLQRSAEAGFARHLAKPPSLEKLEELLRSLPGEAGGVRSGAG